AALLDREEPAMVGQRMDEHGGVLARLDNLIEVADRAAAHRLRQGSIDPHRLVRLDKEAADEVAAGEVFMASDRDQFIRTVLEAGEPMGHVLDEPGLTASRRTLEQHG